MENVEVCTVKRTHQKHRVAPAMENLLNCECDLANQGIRDVRNDEPNRHRPTGSEALRYRVPLETEGGHGIENSIPHEVRNSGFTVQHPRDG